MICKIIGGIFCLLIVIAAIVIAIVFLLTDGDGCKHLIGEESCCNKIGDTDWKGCKDEVTLLTNLLTNPKVDYAKKNNFCRSEEKEEQPTNSSYLCHVKQGGETERKYCTLLCADPENHNKILKENVQEQYEKLTR